MSDVREARENGAAMSDATRRRRHARGLALLVGLAAWSVAATAPALVITGGPVYSLPGGGSCTITGEPARGSGATISCTGVNLSAHSNVYIGIRNDTNPNGNTMTGATPSGGSIFTFSGAGSSCTR